MEERGQSRRKIIAAAFGSGAVMAALPTKARAEEIHDDLFVYGSAHLIRDKRPDVAPELHFVGQRGEWLIGSDVANNGGGGRDFVLAGHVRRDPATGRATVGDLIYLTPGGNGVRVGVGRTPPTQGFRLEIGDQGSDGGLAIVQGAGCTGDAFAIFDATGAKHFSIDSRFQIHAPELEELRQRVAALEDQLQQETTKRRRKDKRLRLGLNRLRKRISR